MKYYSFFFLIIFFVLLSDILGQRVNRDSINVFQDSKNGYALPVSGHIHILVIFAEVIYDTGTDPCPPEGTKEWPAGKLPLWKDQLLNPFPSHNPTATISSFFYESSFGNYIVTGDYLVNTQFPNRPVQINASENVNVKTILKHASSFNQFKTANNFSISDFDKWTLPHIGHEKITPSIDDPIRIDHLMIIIRNSVYPGKNSGIASSRSAGRFFGYESDTYSFFCTHDRLPFKILVHEYGHMLFGGNNFHIAGSHSKRAGHTYFPNIQGGWGIMGAAWRSFLTTNAWERRRLGWKPDNKQWFISAMDSTGKQEAYTDLDAMNTAHEGIYLIRDFVTTGDAIRIKLPFLSDDVFQQWLWIENHQTESFNKSGFDIFQYEHFDCIDNATPGLYMYLQVDKEVMTGTDAFKGYADYLKIMPANGNWDFVWGDTAVQNPWCVNNVFYFPHAMQKGKENPLSGSTETELVFGDYNNNAIIEIEEYRMPAIRKKGNQYQINLPFMGAREHAFTYKGNRRIGIDTNPSSASMLTTINAGSEIHKGSHPNNRKVYLNGISVEILNITPPLKGAVYVRVRFDDYEINQNVRWCADTIVLSGEFSEKPRILSVNEKSQLHLDRGLSATRLSKPDTFSGKHVFSNPSVFILEYNTELHLKNKSTLRIDNGSTIIVRAGASIRMDKKTTIIITENSKLIFESGANLYRQNGSKIKISSNSKLHQM